MLLVFVVVVFVVLGSVVVGLVCWFATAVCRWLLLLVLVGGM